jgi:hypothetical protein
MLVGAADDVVEQGNATAAAQQMGLATSAGLDAVRISAQWSSGETTLAPETATAIANAVAAAQADQVRLIVSLYPFGSSVTPLADQDRADFVAWVTDAVKRFPYVHDWIVGNEPNLNRFWLPQFGPGGEDVAAQTYEALLAQTYDAIKQVEPHSTVYGGALAPHGIDRPGSGRDTHSPTAFIADMGAAYRASGRAVPIMDAFAFHPYGDNSSQPPTFAHPNSTSIGIADYDKLVALLGTAFDGTAQHGSTLPILYDEYGIETQIPDAKTGLYTGTEPSTIHPVDEATQASYYQQALQLAFCQKTVIGLLYFHFVDEPARAAWQSGLYYADGTPKASLAPVKTAIAQAHGGSVASCPGLRLTPKASLAASVDGRHATVTLTSSLDARYSLVLQWIGGTRGRPVTGTVTASTPKVLHWTLHPGRYRWTATVTAQKNAGKPATRTSNTVVVP